MSLELEEAFRHIHQVDVDVDSAVLMENACERVYQVGVDESDLSEVEEDGDEESNTVRLSTMRQEAVREARENDGSVCACTQRPISPPHSTHMATPHNPSPTPLLAVYSLIQGKHPSAPPPSAPPPSAAPFSTPPPSTPPPSAPPSSASPRSASHSENQDASSRPAKKQKLQDPRNRHRRDKRAQRRAESGIPAGLNLAHKKHVLSAHEMTSRLQSAMLPAASGGFIGVEADWYGAQARRELEQMKERGFWLVEWRAGKGVPLVDAEHRVMVCMLNGPDDPGYQQAVEEMTESILKASEETDWQKKEKRHKCGHFPALARGISYGKGQHEPMRLVGDRQPMMEELFNKSCFKRVAGFQNDAKNDVRIPCAITTGGKYDYKQSGHLILWDFKLILEFPPGATILLPSALIRHSNLPLADGETRVSVTQYTAGGIRHWLEYGGRTEDEFCTQDPQGFAHTWAKHREGWTQGLNLFSTLDKLKSCTF
ncbi:hypothetical protein F5879DRAFT_994244 [Lentinula edodes]|nr:hypothetical protein F5879DRAFT_994244 [Lentinula edodes]